MPLKAEVGSGLVLKHGRLRQRSGECEPQLEGRGVCDL